MIGVAHLVIDIWKSYRKDEVVWFTLDQVLHLLVIAGVAYVWTRCHDWCLPFDVELWHVAVVVALLVCWKPANIFIKLMLKHYSVNMPEDKENAVMTQDERWNKRYQDVMEFLAKNHRNPVTSPFRGARYANWVKQQNSGAGRIAPLNMRPMTLWESMESKGTVSLNDLFEGGENFPWYPLFVEVFRRKSNLIIPINRPAVKGIIAYFVFIIIL